MRFCLPRFSLEESGKRLRWIVLECVIPVNHLLPLHSLLPTLCVSPSRDSVELPSFFLLCFGSKHFFFPSAVIILWGVNHTVLEEGRTEPSCIHVENVAWKCEMTRLRSHSKLVAIKGPESRLPRLNSDIIFYHASEKLVLVVFLETYN